MSDTGLLYGGSAANVAGPGTQAWSNPTNANGNNTNDATAATIAESGSLITSTKYLVCSFTHGLLSTDTIVGITAAIRRYSTLNDTDAPQDGSVKLYVNGSIQGTEKKVVTSWPQSGAWSADYGGSSDTWGLSLTGSNTIGLGVSGGFVDPNDTIYVTAMRMTIYYTSANNLQSVSGFFRLLGT